MAGGRRARNDRWRQEIGNVHAHGDDPEMLKECEEKIITPNKKFKKEGRRPLQA